MYHSLNNALHSLRNPYFSGRLHAHLNRARKKEEATSSEKAFEAELRDRLSQLQSTGEQGFLSLSWLQDAVKLVLFTCAQIANLLPKITCTEKEKSLLEWNLEDTLSLLDVCNGLKEVLNDVQHYVMLVRYAARTGADLNDASEEQTMPKLSRLHDALVKSAEFMHARVEENSRHNEGRSKLETCSSMLRRMVEPVGEPSLSNKRAASNALFNDMDAAKMLAIFVCSVLAIALSVKPKRPLSHLSIGDQPNWLELLQTLQQNVKKLTDSGIEHGKVAFLKELDEVRVQTDKIFEKLNTILKQETTISETDRLSISRECEKLSKDSDELQGGLHVLQRHIDGLFRMLVTIRVDFLDALCHV